MSASLEELQELLGHYPTMVAAFAYGSGVVEQGGYDYSAVDPSQLPMLDMIFIVEDSTVWHTENMKLNPGHYTSMIAFNPAVVAAVQDNLGAYVWFNAYIPMKTIKSPHRMIKYGVIQRSFFLNDLNNWDSLYIAGRLHKPVLMVKSTAEIDDAMQSNRMQALRAAMLLLPKCFSELDLYLGIASLSYIGDPRMLIGENPRKVLNLVTPIVPFYRSMYASTVQIALDKPITIPIVGTKEQIVASCGPVLKLVSSPSSGATIYMQEESKEARWSLCQGLPLTMRRLLFIQGRARFLKQKPPTRGAIRTALATLVARSASSQSMKGLLTVGVVKSVTYIFSKVAKRIWGK